MQPLPGIAPISDMRVRQAHVVELAKQGPVVLVERGSKPALVVVSPDQWNAIAERLELLENEVASYKKASEGVAGQDNQAQSGLLATHSGPMLGRTPKVQAAYHAE